METETFLGVTLLGTHLLALVQKVYRQLNKDPTTVIVGALKSLGEVEG